jgi:hypothetical protein
VNAPVDEPEERVARPDWETEKRVAPVEEDTRKGLAPVTPSTERVAIGVEVPTPSLVLVLSKKKLALFCATSPPVVTKGTDPAVRPER